MTLLGPRLPLVLQDRQPMTEDLAVLAVLVSMQSSKMDPGAAGLNPVCPFYCPAGVWTISDAASRAFICLAEGEAAFCDTARDTLDRSRKRQLELDSQRYEDELRVFAEEQAARTVAAVTLAEQKRNTASTLAKTLQEQEVQLQAAEFHHHRKESLAASRVKCERDRRQQLAGLVPTAVPAAGPVAVSAPLVPAAAVPAAVPLPAPKSVAAATAPSVAAAPSASAIVAAPASAYKTAAATPTGGPLAARARSKRLCTDGDRQFTQRTINDLAQKVDPRSSSTDASAVVSRALDLILAVDRDISVMPLDNLINSTGRVPSATERLIHELLVQFRTARSNIDSPPAPAVFQQPLERGRAKTAGAGDGREDGGSSGERSSSRGASRRVGGRARSSARDSSTGGARTASSGGG